MAMTFGTVSLIKARFEDGKYPGAFSKTTLLSGNVLPQGLPTSGLEIDLICTTQNFADITNLSAKMNQVLTLTLGSLVVTNMMLAGDIHFKPNENFTIFDYFPKFVQRTV